MIKSHMRTDKIEKKHKNRDGGVSRFKRAKATFGFVPRLKSGVEGFD